MSQFYEKNQDIKKSNHGTLHKLNINQTFIFKFYIFILIGFAKFSISVKLFYYHYPNLPGQNNPPLNQLKLPLNKFAFKVNYYMIF